MSPLTSPSLPTTDVLTRSEDLPSTGEVRPFGLTRTAPTDEVADLTGITYDPDRQLNVAPSGSAVIDAPAHPAMGTTYNTQFDHQWFTDKD